MATDTRDNIRLLVKLNDLQATLSGPAKRKLCERAYRIFGQEEYERLAGSGNPVRRRTSPATTSRLRSHASAVLPFRKFAVRER